MARVWQWNSVDYLARLAAATRELLSDARFVLIVQGAELDDVRALVRELGVPDRRFYPHGKAQKQEMAAAFAAPDVVTLVVIDLPELEANSANKFFDGLAAGRPIALNYGGWRAELLEASSRGRRS